MSVFLATRMISGTWCWRVGDAAAISAVVTARRESVSTQTGRSAARNSRCSKLDDLEKLLEGQGWSGSVRENILKVVELRGKTIRKTDSTFSGRARRRLPHKAGAKGSRKPDSEKHRLQDDVTRSRRCRVQTGKQLTKSCQKTVALWKWWKTAQQHSWTR